MPPPQGPRLPTALHVKSFWSMDEAFETPVDQLLYQRVRRPLTKLLGGKFYSPRTFTPSGYTIGELQTTPPHTHTLHCHHTGSVI